ncbi:hypothetical protein JW968_04630 [Candidatus Woesearchaeota archaeon]|nr:hypothetical protein [Candidatus Woesearchaeota archaeon]
MSLDVIVLVKPEAYQRLDVKAAEGYFKAEQRVLSALKEGLIERGIEQIAGLTGFSDQNLPAESPARTVIELDDINFVLSTSVRRTNPQYQKAMDKITGFLEVLANDWKKGIRKDNVRTYDGKPFVEWDYLMQNVLFYTSRVTGLGVQTQIESISAPSQYDEPLDRLAVPVALMRDFDIRRPGTAELWYRGRRFYDDVENASVKPVKKELARKSKVTLDEMPPETQKYWEQLGAYLFTVQSIPSPRRQPGKVHDRLFLIPEKSKPKGSTALPLIHDPDNYTALLEEYRPGIQTALKRWKNLEGNIGEIVTFYYGIEDEAKVAEQFPYLPEYSVKRDGSKTFVSIQALYDRIMALEQDYTKNRLLRRHTQSPIV